MSRKGGRSSLTNRSTAKPRRAGGQRQAVRAAAAVAGGHEDGGQFAPQAELEPAIEAQPLVQRLHRHHQAGRAAGELQRLAVVRHPPGDRLQARHQRVLHAQRVAVVLVVGMVDADVDVAGAAVERDRRGVAGIDLEPHERGAAVERRRFRGLQERPAEAVAAMLGAHRHRVQPGERGAAVEQDQRVAEQPALLLGHQAFGGIAGEEMTEAAPRQAVVLEAARARARAAARGPRGRRGGSTSPARARRGAAGSEPPARLSWGGVYCRRLEDRHGA